MSGEIKKEPSAAAVPSKFNFIVHIGVHEFYFNEISGLDNENQVKDFRENEPRFQGQMASEPVQKNGTVTLKRGFFKGDKEYWAGVAGRNLNEQKEDVTISLLNDAGEIVRRWKIYNAFPAKVEAPDLKAAGNEVAIETLELSHEGISAME